MKIISISFWLMMVTVAGYAQETITLSGGVVLARAIDYSSYYNQDYNTDATGFRITGTYEIGPLEAKKYIHGFTSSYMLSTATVKNSYYEDIDIAVRTIPICYSPKYMFGGEKAMAFVKASAGMQFTRIKVGGDIDESDNDFGFYGGIGGGGMLYLSQKVFLNLEYELAFMSNTYYANGYINSVQLGIGIDL